MLNHFRKRLAPGKSSPGLLVISQSAPIGPVEAIIVLWTVSDPAELRDSAHHLPSLATLGRKDLWQLLIGPDAPP